MPRLVPTLVIAGVTTVVLVGGGLLVLGGGDDDTADTPAAPSGPVEARDIALDDFDTSAAVIARDAFCDQIPEESVLAALSTGGADAEVTDQADWANGDDVVLDDGSTDVAHEYGCRYESTTRRRTVTAEAWVYAPPVTAAEADDLLEAAGGTDGCTTADDAPAFGSPSVALTCATTGNDATATASFRGLFGDAWLTCQVSVPQTDQTDQADADLLDRAGRWCVTAARAAES